MATSIHDNKLISYTVNERTRQITLQTIFDEKSPAEPTEVIFRGVEAYFFEDHALSLGTILDGLNEVDPNRLVDGSWALFQKGRAFGWPGPWAETKEKASAFFAANAIRGFEITSSCGMNGWVMARELKLVRSPG